MSDTPEKRAERAWRTIWRDANGHIADSFPYKPEEDDVILPEIHAAEAAAREEERKCNQRLWQACYNYFFNNSMLADDVVDEVLSILHSHMPRTNGAYRDDQAAAKAKELKARALAEKEKEK